MTNANVATATATTASQRPRKGWGLALALACAIAMLTLAGALAGSTGFESVRHAWGDALARQILWDIRLPRTVGALLAGGLLGLAGSVAQGLFRNPLADPYLLGSSSGAGLGVGLAMALAGAPSSFSWPWLAHVGITGAAFVGAVLAVLLTLVLARGVQGSLRLLLAGVVVGFVLGAATDMLLLTRPHIMQAMQSFVLGTTGFVSWQSCLVMAGAWLLCMLAAWSMSRALDALALGEATARTLGLPLGTMQAALIAVLALATASAVAQTGLLGFIGLAAPHLVRSMVKVWHAQLLLLSSLMGAVLLGVADLLARTLIAPAELPVGVLTALLGGAYLLYWMHCNKAAGQGPHV